MFVPAYSIHLFSIPSNPSVGSRGGWSPSQRSSGERRGTPWTGRQCPGILFNLKEITQNVPVTASVTQGGGVKVKNLHSAGYHQLEIWDSNHSRRISVPAFCFETCTRTSTTVDWYWIVDTYLNASLLLLFLVSCGGPDELLVHMTFISITTWHLDLNNRVIFSNTWWSTVWPNKTRAQVDLTTG